MLSILLRAAGTLLSLLPFTVNLWHICGYVELQHTFLVFVALFLLHLLLLLFYCCGLLVVAIDLDAVVAFLAPALLVLWPSCCEFCFACCCGLVLDLLMFLDYSYIFLTDPCSCWWPCGAPTWDADCICCDVGS